MSDREKRAWAIGSLIAFPVLVWLLYRLLTPSVRRIIFQATYPNSVYLPMVQVNAQEADPRFQVWLADEVQARSVGFGPANIIRPVPQCLSCETQYVPMSDYWCAVAGAFAMAEPGRVFILGDEPDYSGLELQQYWAWYTPCKETIMKADPTARVSWAGISQNGGTAYADELLYLSRVPMPTAQLRFHAFAGPGNLGAWQDLVRSWVLWRDANMPGVPLVLGSFGYPGTSEAEPSVLQDATAALEWLPTTPLASWAWWSWDYPGEPNDLWRDGGLTTMGHLYRQKARTF